MKYNKVIKELICSVSNGDYFLENKRSAKLILRHFNKYLV